MSDPIAPEQCPKCGGHYESEDVDYAATFVGGVAICQSCQHQWVYAPPDEPRD
jgi:hypothetical protein